MVWPGAPADKRDARGVTPLASAAGAGQLAVVKALVRARADQGVASSASAKWPPTPLLHQCFGGHS